MLQRCFRFPAAHGFRWDPPVFLADPLKAKALTRLTKAAQRASKLQLLKVRGPYKRSRPISSYLCLELTRKIQVPITQSLEEGP